MDFFVAVEYTFWVLIQAESLIPQATGMFL